MPIQNMGFDARNGLKSNEIIEFFNRTYFQNCIWYYVCIKYFYAILFMFMLDHICLGYNDSIKFWYDIHCKIDIFEWFAMSKSSNSIIKMNEFFLLGLFMIDESRYQDIRWS